MYIYIAIGLFSQGTGYGPVLRVRLVCAGTQLRGLLLRGSPRPIASYVSSLPNWEVNPNLDIYVQTVDLYIDTER